MSWKFILFAVIGFSLLLGPIFTLRPKPHEAKRERWRLAIRSKGLHFALRSLPQKNGESSGELLAAYTQISGKPADDKGWTLIKVDLKHDIHCADYWDWQDEVRPSAEQISLLENLLPTLPEYVKAVAGSGSGITVFWTEQGNDADFETVLNFLSRMVSVQR